MSQKQPSIDETIKRQQQTMQQNQESIARAMTTYMQEAMKLQRSLAQITLNGLELADSTQRMGVDLTRSMVQSYFDTFESVQGQGGQQPPQHPPQQPQFQPPPQQQPPQQQPPQHPPQQPPTQEQESVGQQPAERGRQTRATDEAEGEQREDIEGLGPTYAEY